MSRKRVLEELEGRKTHVMRLVAFPYVLYDTGTNTDIMMCNMYCKFNVDEMHCILFGNKSMNQRLPRCVEAEKAIDFSTLEKSIRHWKEVIK